MNLGYLNYLPQQQLRAARDLCPLKYIAKEERPTAKPNLEHSKKRANLGSYISKFFMLEPRKWSKLQVYHHLALIKA